MKGNIMFKAYPTDNDVITASKWSRQGNPDIHCLVKNNFNPSSSPYNSSVSTYLPPDINISSIFIDESGSRNSKGGFFVIGFVKVRKQALLAREIRQVRQKHHYHNEIKFSSIKTRDLPFYNDLAELIAQSDVRLGGSVYNSTSGFTSRKETWKQQADMARRLVVANINRKGELVNVFLDLVQTPRGQSVAEIVKHDANRVLGGRCVIEAYDMDSRSTDLLQIADLVASSIAYERKNANKPDVKPGKRVSAKARFSARLRRALELDSFDDTHHGKINILTMNS